MCEHLTPADLSSFVAHTAAQAEEWTVFRGSFNVPHQMYHSVSQADVTRMVAHWRGVGNALAADLLNQVLLIGEGSTVIAATSEHNNKI